ncbi:MAG: IS21 family transposase [Dethiobacteria bacterium]|nr:IS21 family transposase [Bacillota bacterium]
MAQVNCIREMFFEKGMSYADIARTTGHDVKTVKKYIYMEDFNQPPPKPTENRGSKLDKYKSKIDDWLEADKQERKKQRHTAKRVYDRLKAMYSPDFDCSYRLVAAYVSQKKKLLYSTQDQFYMPLEHICGEAQVDFGEADFFEGNVRYTGHYLNVSFPQSNAGYLQLFKGENMQCLAEGLMNIFAHIGGAPKRIWFDNLSPAVKKILKNHGRELTNAFLRFKNHYGFEAAFCNAGKGNEKGHVENKVGYHRRNILVPVPRIDDLKAYNRHLLEVCDQDMMRPHYSKERLIKELFEDDRKALLPLPAVAFDESEFRSVRTNSYAKFTLNGGKHTYSTAPKYANSELFVRLTAHEVIVLDESYREVKRHPRLYGEQEQESMDWLPYLTQLSRRPAALKYTGIYPMLPEPVQEFLNTCDYEAKKETLKVLARLSIESGFEKAAEALQAALEHGARDAESIKAVFSRLNSEILNLDPLVLPASVPEMPPVKVNVDKYDRLFLKGAPVHEN